MGHAVGLPGWGDEQRTAGPGGRTVPGQGAGALRVHEEKHDPAAVKERQDGSCLSPIPTLANLSGMSNLRTARRSNYMHRLLLASTLTTVANNSFWRQLEELGGYFGSALPSKTGQVWGLAALPHYDLALEQCSTKSEKHLPSLLPRWKATTRLLRGLAWPCAEEPLTGAG